MTEPDDDLQRIADRLAALIAKLPVDEQDAFYAMAEEHLRDLESGDVTAGEPVDRDTLRLTFEYFLSKRRGV